MIGIFAEQNIGHCRFGWHATGDQSRRCSRLNQAVGAAAAGVFRAAGHDHAELGGHDVKPFLYVNAFHPATSQSSSETLKRIMKKRYENNNLACYRGRWDDGTSSESAGQFTLSRRRGHHWHQPPPSFPKLSEAVKRRGFIQNFRRRPPDRVGPTHDAVRPFT